MQQHGESPDQAKVRDILSKQNTLLDQQEYYQYEMKITTFGTRLNEYGILRFLAQGKTDSAASLYFIASKELLKREQINSGYSLAQKAIEIYPKGDIDAQIQGEFLSLYSVAPLNQQKILFINKVLQKFTNCHASICEQVAIDLINNKVFDLAWRYIVHSQNVDLQTSFLQKWNNTLSASDQEFNVTRYLLIKLSMGKDSEVKDIFNNLKRDVKGFLIDLFGLTLKAVELKSKNAFQEIFEKYRPVFNDDKLYEDVLITSEVQLLYKVGAKYFGLQVQNQQGGGIGGLLQSFFQ